MDIKNNLIRTIAAVCMIFCLLGMARKNPTSGIINTHEHMRSINDVPKYLEAMKAIGVKKTVLLGSSATTLLPGRLDFSGWEENNLEILKIVKAYPGRFVAYPTIDVQDPQKLEKLQKFISLGGQGLKLYSGHVILHKMRLDDESMMPVYAYCEKEQIPVLFHANVGYYQEEFENILKRFPRIKMICPHLCLSSIKAERLEYLMDTYPHLYTDLSFGYMDLLTPALKRFSRDPEKFRRLITKYQDRIFFGTDMIVSDETEKTVEWLTQVARVYRDVLEKKEYQFFALPDQTLRGLALSPEILEKIYRSNFERFFRERNK